jgi:uncharacterized protein (TIGR00251 family)
VSVLEWIFISELVLLATAGMFWVAGLAIGRDNPDDPFTSFYETFWRVFLRRRGKLRAAVTALDEHKARQYAEMKQSGDVEGIKELLGAELGDYHWDESEITEALGESIAAPSAASGAAAAAANAGAAGMRSALLNIKVIPFAKQNELVSMRRDGVTIQVTCGPEEGQANKAVIDLIAQTLAVKPYQVTLLKGHYKAFKTVQIAGYDQTELDLKMASYS